MPFDAVSARELTPRNLNVAAARGTLVNEAGPDAGVPTEMYPDKTLQAPEGVKEGKRE